MMTNLGKEEKLTVTPKKFLQESSQAAEEHSATIKDHRRQWEIHSATSSPWFSQEGCDDD
jgi:hypothetical protein